MVSPVIDRRIGLAGNNGAKQPVTVVATSNVTQSGEQTISGIALLASNAAGVPDRVLCTAQTNPIYNGVWEVQTGSWVRPDDMNGTGDIVRGTQVRVARGLSAGTTWYMTAADPVVIGTSSQTWSQDPEAAETNITYGAIITIIDGVLTQHASLAAAVTAIGSNRCTVVVRDDITMAASATFPATALLDVQNRARITTTGFTLTANFKDPGPVQMFVGSGTVALVSPGLVRPQWWGAAADWNGSSGTDDTTAMMAACSAMNAAGGGILDLGSGRYRVAVSSGQTIGDFTNARGIRIASSGAEIAIDRSFTVGQIYQLFEFNACSNVEVEALKVSCTYAGTGSAKFDRGYEVFKLLQGCNGFTIHDLQVSAVRSALMCRRESGDPTSYSSRNIKGRIRATNVGYPASFILAGDQVDLSLDTEGCTRSYYPYGCAGHRIKLRSKNSEGNADAYLSSAGGLGLSGIDLEYQDYDSTGTDGSLRKVTLSFGDQTPAVHRDIRVRVDLKLSGTNYVGTPFELEKLNNSGSYDSSDRGHRVEGLEVDCNVKSGSSSQPSLRICSGGTWSTGEFLNAIRIRLQTDGAGQPTINLASLVDRALIENSYSSAQVNLTGGTGYVDVINSTASAWSYTGKVRFDGALIGSATLDPANLAAGATQQSTVTVTGAAVGDHASASHSAVDAGIVWLAQVTSADTVTVTQWNRSGSPIDLASGTVRCAVRKGAAP